MIVGIGTDIVSIKRVDQMLERLGERFAERVLSAEEMIAFQESKFKSSFLSKRFAAKEAFVKALGTGFTSGIVMNQITIRHDNKGKPFLYVTGNALQELETQKATATHLSISDEKEHAVAFVVLEHTSVTYTK